MTILMPSLFRMALMSFNGSPSTTRKSAYSPGFTVPKFFSWPTHSAAQPVAVWMACMLERPRSTISSISRALSPWTNPPASVPAETFTPALTAMCRLS